MLLMHVIGQAQGINCVESVTISLNPWGTAELNADMFLEGGQDLTNESVDINAVDCDDIAASPLTITVTADDSGETFSCTSELTVEDRTPPVAISKEPVYLVLSVDGEATLEVSDVDNGSFDQCSPTLEYELSKTAFTTNDLGENDVTFTVTDVYNNWNQTLVTVIVVEPVTNLACNDLINISLDATGSAIPEADWFLEGGPYDYNDLEVDPASLDCDDIGANIQYTVKSVSTGNTCWGELSVVDKLAPAVILKNNVTLSLTPGQNGESPAGRIFSTTLDNGSFDNCTPQEELIFEPEYFDLDCSDLGEVDLTVTVIDEYGNEASTYTTINVIFVGPEPEVILCPSDIVVDCSIELDDETVIENILGEPTIDNPGICANIDYQDVYGYDQNEDGDLDDTFELDGELIYEDYNVACKYGTISRSWTTANGLGCTQLIYVKNDGDTFDGTSMIDWPYSDNYFVDLADNDGSMSCNDLTASSSVDLESADENGANITIDCIEDFCEEPIWEEPGCSLIGWNLQSDTFYFDQGVCAVIQNRYTVINWCQYDDATGDGSWDYTVVAKYNDTDPAIIESEDTEISLACSDERSLSAYFGEVGTNCQLGTYKVEVYLDLFADEEIDYEWSSFSPIDLGNQNSPLWDDDDNNGIPDVRVGNPGNVDNLSTADVPQNFVYTINLPDDLPATTGNQSHIARWKVYDACGNATQQITNFTVTGEPVDDKAPTPYCINAATLLLTPDMDGNASATIYATDFNIGSFDNCTPAHLLRYTFEDINPAQDPSYNEADRSSSILITSPGGADEFDINMNMYVWDESDNRDYCATTLTVIVGECGAFSWDDDISYPLDLIEISAFGVPSESLTPEYLADNFEYALEDVMPVANDCWEEYIYVTYTDLVLNIGDGAYKILRTFTILNWMNAEVNEYLQVIKNYSSGDFICDWLPRSSTFDDCELGHSLSDDVEWPNDIVIEDHRIDPSELVLFSGVDPLDARPSFYNEPDMYEATFVDFLEELTVDTLKIKRVWTVERIDIQDVSWVYDQFINIDLTQFEPLISTNTLGLRPIPGVEVSTGVLTDDNGVVLNIGIPDIDPKKSDIAHNGLTIKDIMMIRSHILGITVLSPEQQMAGDVSTGDSFVSTIDLVMIERVILGIDTETSTEWTFTNITSDVTGENTDAVEYLGIKPGDVDDDATLDSFTAPDPAAAFQAEDIVMNAGQTYTVDIALSNGFSSLGLESHFDINPELISILEVNGETEDWFGSWNITNDSELHVTSYSNDVSSGDIEAGAVILTIEIFALQNTTLAEALNGSATRPSYVLDDAFELHLIDMELNNVIPSNNEEVNEELLVVYPNPASEFIQIQADKVSSVQLFDLTGQLVLQSKGDAKIPVHMLSAGQYLYSIQTEKGTNTGKLEIVH